jgi:uncharacterized damage-inducible protein DinB
MKTIITQVTCDRWANLRLLHSAAGMDHQTFNCALPSSFPSVQQTFVHLFWAESLWLARWQGRSDVASLNSEDYPTAESLSVQFEDVHTRQLQFLSSLPPSAATQVVGYVNFSGKKWEHALRGLVQHLVVHSAHHRGQITTLFRHLNIVRSTLKVFLNPNKYPIPFSCAMRIFHASAGLMS